MPYVEPKLTWQWASIGYSRSIDMYNRSFSTWLRDKMNSVIFKITLGIVDIAFLGTRIKQCMSSVPPGKRCQWTKREYKREQGRRRRG